MAVEELDKGNDDGTRLGQSSSSLISAYGATPCDQPANVTSVTTTAATSTTNAYGYSTSTQADAIVTAVNAIITNLEEIGWMASS